MTLSRESFKSSDYPKLRNALEQVDNVIYKVEIAEQNHEAAHLASDERRFYDAYSKHWVHADKRTVLTVYIYKLLVGALRG